MGAQRRCMVVRGTPEQTAQAALEIIDPLDPGDVVWVGPRSPSGVVQVGSGGLRRLLGQSVDALVLDLHDGLNANQLGRGHGLIRGGGGLVLRMPPTGVQPTTGLAALAAAPFTAENVGTRLWDRLERALAASRAVVAPEPLTPPPRVTRGSAEQAQLVALLQTRLRADRPQVSVITADRGRGKSSALGLALAASPHLQAIAVTAADPRAATEVLRFAGGAARFVPLTALLTGEEHYDVIVIDEAAALSLPSLQRLTRGHPDAHLAFATTTRGYEGSGRGFTLRFLDWVRTDPRPLHHDTLHTPIRWGPEDPLERLVFHTLALDAAPAVLPQADTSGHPGGAPASGPLVATPLDPAELAADDRLLREFFGLLVHAHYRTTPADLHHLLDAPNLRAHALLDHGRVVAATLVALEGGLDRDTIRAMATGRERIRGHALADTLICHAGHPSAGALRIVRSVRIAVHPRLRRRGLAQRLVDHVHSAYAPDLFGTMFGLSPKLLRFRRAVGYTLVRVGVSRGARTGEPAAVMVHPVSPRARDLVAGLRAELARDLPLQLRAMANRGDLWTPDGAASPLPALLGSGLPVPTPIDDRTRQEDLASYLFGPRPSDAVLPALRATLSRHSEAADTLPRPVQDLVQARLFALDTWPRAARSAGYPSTRSAHRALRRALRRWIGAVEPAVAALGEGWADRRLHRPPEA